MILNILSFVTVRLTAIVDKCVQSENCHRQKRQFQFLNIRFSSFWMLIVS